MTTQVTHTTELATRRSKRRGFTLTEIAIVLGIMGLILGAIWVAASAVYTNMRVSAQTRDIIALSQGVRQLYANQGVMDAITTANLIQSGAVPSDMINGAVLTNEWGGVTTFTPATQINAAGDSFVIDVGSVPQTSCVGLLTDSSVGSNATGSGIYGLNARPQAGGIYTTIAAVGQTVNYTGTLAVTACAGATNHVAYAFSLK